MSYWFASAQLYTNPYFVSWRVFVILSVYSTRISLKTNLTNLKACGIDPREVSHAPFNKSAWRSQGRDAVIDFEDRRRLTTFKAR